MHILQDIALAAKYVVGVTIIYWLVVFFYRIYLHPLSKYPGPLIAKFTDAYIGFYAFQRRLHLVNDQNHQKYGKVIRVAPNRLLFNSPKALRDIYDNPRVVKSHVYLTTLGFTGTTNIFNVVDKTIHRSKRRLIGAGVSDRAMREFEPTMSSQIDIFLTQLLLASPTNTPVNMSRACEHLSMDIIGHLAFGYAMNTQTEARFRALQPGIVASAAHNNLLMQWPRLQSRLSSFLLHHATLSTQKRLFELVETMVRARMAAGKDARKDWYAQMEREDAEFRQSEVWSEALFLIPAGADTTAATLSALFFHLSHPQNSAIYARLASEIRTTFTHSSAIHSGPQLSSCVYLRACIDEALRLASPVNGALWRELSPEEEEDEGGKKKDPLIVDGVVVPPGVQVGVNLYTLHHDADYFPAPYTFSPERWLRDGEDRRAREAFAPFSIGYRGCAGRAMAYLEASLVVARVLWFFDFARAEGSLGTVGGGKEGDRNGRHRGDEFQLFDVVASCHDGPVLVFKPREGAGEIGAE